ncbi:MAG: N-acetylneuraminate synthase [Mucinivorans sp.]
MSHTLIIAEAGVNHNGSIDTARRLIDVAGAAGVDYVKFQTFKADRLVSRSAQKAQYQQDNMAGADTSQYAMLRALELSPADHYELIEHCRSKNVAFFSTAFDLESIDFLSSLDMPMWKVPSGEITNFPYLRKIGQTQKPVILSTGMATMGEIEDAINVLTRFGTPRAQITLLHCTTEYPTPKAEVNLRAMQTMNRVFGLRVGYSDHTQGIEIPVAAVAMGACVIEKHFTLDRAMQGPDHLASIEPIELEQMVAQIRNVEQALGDGVKQATLSEKPNIVVARKSIVAARAIKKGERLTEENITVKRPACGISPMEWERVVGQVAVRDFMDEETIEI